MQATEQSALLEDVSLTAKRIFSLIAAELEQVETEFERQARSNVQVIAYLADYLRASGGKRVRPALTILSNYAVGGDGGRYNSIRMATVMEFLHTATLVHDDVIDNSDTRRNRPTVNALYGNETAVLMGDWLYMSAFETSLAERSLPILDVLTAVTRRMTEGELLQLTTLGNVNVTEAQYLDIIQRKTAYLFSACCEVGAILGGANDREQKSLAEYGMHLGMAFQLTDDLLDFTASDEALGKSAGVDLIGGKITLPLIYLLESNPSEADRLQRIMDERGYTTTSRVDLLDALDQADAIDRARNTAREFATRAGQVLDDLPGTDYSEILRLIPTYVLDRDR